MDKDELLALLAAGERVNLECKKATDTCPKDVWETYSAFANAGGGHIVLGVRENLKATSMSDRFEISGVTNPHKILTEFWNGINSDERVSANILVDSDATMVDCDGRVVIVIHVPQASYLERPVYINGNPYKGTYRRAHEGDYHAQRTIIQAMIRDATDTGGDVGLLEGYTLEDIDAATLKAYRIEFEHRNPDHVWCELDDAEFLRNLGAIGLDRATGKRWLTAAGLLMFGTGLAIRERFSGIRMDFIDMTNLAPGERWSHRLTYDGMWENNLYQFMRRILPWLMEGLRRPFRLEGIVRVDDTPLHKSLREATVNMLIHADYMVQGVLKVEKTEQGFVFSNPGLLKLPVASIYEGGHSMARNPHIQTMLRMIGLGENVGSGIPTILRAWQQAGYAAPTLAENSDVACVELTLPMDLAPIDTKQYGDKENIILTRLASGSATMKEIIALLGMSSSGTTKIVNRLINDGVVERTRQGRAVYYVIK